MYLADPIDTRINFFSRKNNSIYSMHKIQIGWLENYRVHFFRTKHCNIVCTQKMPQRLDSPSCAPRTYNNVTLRLHLAWRMIFSFVWYSNGGVFFLWPNFTNGICLFPSNFAFPSASSLIILYCLPANNNHIPKCQMRMVYNFLPHSTAIQLNRCANESISQ